MQETAQQLADRLMRELFNLLPIDKLGWSDQVGIQNMLLQFVPRVREEITAFAGHKS